MANSDEHASLFRVISVKSLKQRQAFAADDMMSPGVWTAKLYSRNAVRTVVS